MTRYDFDVDIPDADVVRTESPTGEYVRWEDAEARIAELVIMRDRIAELEKERDCLKHYEAFFFTMYEVVKEAVDAPKERPTDKVMMDAFLSTVTRAKKAQARIAALECTLNSTTSQLPDTYYAGRDLTTRVGFMVDHWRRLVTACETMTTERDAATLRAEKAEKERDEWHQIVKDDCDDEEECQKLLAEYDKSNSYFTFGTADLIEAIVKHRDELKARIAALEADCRLLGAECDKARSILAHDGHLRGDCIVEDRFMYTEARAAVDADETARAWVKGATT